MVVNKSFKIITMKKLPLTRIQDETLDFLEEFYSQERYMPSLEEISRYFKISTTSSFERINQLIQRGWIKKIKNQPRGIIIK